METKTLKTWSAAVLAAAVLAGPVALAGERIVTPVTVNTTARWATGAIGSVRNTFDNVQFMGCSVYATTAAISVTCGARDASGTQVGCSTTTPNLVQAAMSIQTDDYLRFEWDSSGQCTAITLHKYSFYEPKTL